MAPILIVPLKISTPTSCNTKINLKVYLLVRALLGLNQYRQLDDRSSLVEDVIIVFKTIYLSRSLLLKYTQICPIPNQYSGQQVRSGLVGHFNLNISRGIKAPTSYALTPIALRLIKRRNPPLPVSIQKIWPIIAASAYFRR